MKILRKLKLNKVDYEAMRREIEVMQMLDEEDNVAKFIETGESFEYVYIIMEIIFVMIILVKMMIGLN